MAAARNHVDTLACLIVASQAPIAADSDAAAAASTPAADMPMGSADSSNSTLDIHDRLGWTALHYAANAGHTRCCDLLVNAGASVNAVTKAGYTAVMLAKLAGFDMCAAHLVVRGGVVPELFVRMLSA